MTDKLVEFILNLPIEAYYAMGIIACIYCMLYVKNIEGLFRYIKNSTIFSVCQVIVVFFLVWGVTTLLSNKEQIYNNICNLFLSIRGLSTSKELFNIELMSVAAAATMLSISTISLSIHTYMKNHKIKMAELCLENKQYGFIYKEEDDSKNKGLLDDLSPSELQLANKVYKSKNHLALLKQSADLDSLRKKGVLTFASDLESDNIGDIIHMRNIARMTKRIWCTLTEKAKKEFDKKK